MFLGLYFIIQSANLKLIIKNISGNKIMLINTLNFKFIKKSLITGLLLSTAQSFSMSGDGSGATSTAITATLASTSLTKLRYPNHDAIRTRFIALNRIRDANQRITRLEVLQASLKADDYRRAHHEPPIAPMTCKWQREISLAIKRSALEQNRIAARHTNYNQHSLAPRRLV